MDKNSVIGLVLIGLIFVSFNIFMQPSEEEIKAEKARIEREDKKKEANKKAKEEAVKAEEKQSNLVAKLNEEGQPVLDSLGNPVFVNADTNNDTTTVEEVKPVVLPEETFSVETDKLIVNFTSKGGQIAGVKLKEYETFSEYEKKDTEIVPLALFAKGDSKSGMVFPMDGKEINTADLNFAVKSKSDERVVFEWKEGKKSIEYIYSLSNGTYDLDFDINMRGFNGKVNPKNVMFQWEANLLKTERLLREQRRVSTICFDYEQDGFSYLSEMAEDDEEAEDDINWVAFKQSYFSSILKAKDGFDKSGSMFEVKNYKEGSAHDSTHIQNYFTALNLGFNNTESASASINWFFGPNDYNTLASYDAGYDEILNYGWGLFRWINVYAIQPLFNILKSSGLAVGLVILLMTIVIKLVLMPVQWKMYTSSAKMRILKPEIDELAKKYPNKEDAMKKQMETMALYRASGASPLAGCVPMLFQMPILLAVFRFFPATFGLRQESFLWAVDLSSFDSIVSWTTNIPVISFIYGNHISLFTLLMAGTTLIYTVMNSNQTSMPQQEGMPNMKIIMYLMPIMMIFFFNNYSSGLSYYYFISTLMSILIMLAIKRFFVDEDKIKAKMAAKKAEAAAGGNKKGKSKFQERLEKMQQMQQEQMKNRKKK